MPQLNRREKHSHDSRQRGMNMQSYSLCDPDAGDDAFDDETIRARVRHLEKRLTERVRTSPVPYEGVPFEEIPCVRWQSTTNLAPDRGQPRLVHSGSSANHY